MVSLVLIIKTLSLFFSSTPPWRLYQQSISATVPPRRAHPVQHRLLLRLWGEGAEERLQPVRGEQSGAGGDSFAHPPLANQGLQDPAVFSVLLSTAEYLAVHGGLLYQDDGAGAAPGEEVS